MISCFTEVINCLTAHIQKLIFESKSRGFVKNVKMIKNIENINWN